MKNIEVLLLLERSHEETERDKRIGIHHSFFHVLYASNMKDILLMVKAVYCFGKNTTKNRTVHHYIV